MHTRIHARIGKYVLVVSLVHVNKMEGFMLEKDIEKKLVAEVRKMGGIAPKFVSPGLDGMPDRLVLLPKGKVAFIEVKAPGKKPRPLQVRRINGLKKLGFNCYVIDDRKQIDEVLRDIGGDAK